MKSVMHEHRHEAVRQRSGAWLDDVAPLLSSAALTLLGILFEIALAKQLGIEPRLRTMLVFISGISVLPICTVTLQHWLDRRSPEAGRLLEATNVWCAVAALVSLALVATTAWASKDGSEFWRKGALHVAEVSAIGYILLIAWLRSACRKEGFLDQAVTVIKRRSSRSTQTIALAFALAAAVIALFRIEPGYRYFNPVFGFVFRTVPGGFPERSNLVLATLTAMLFVLVGAGLLIFERWLVRNRPAHLRSFQRAALAFALVAGTVLTFDFSLAADPFHYMTVVGPALHLLHGGTLMVDTFSQYGPGPVLVAYLAFQLGPPSFAVANIAIQLCNLIFYTLFIVALWQSSRSRMSAVWFGLVFILFWLSDWNYGQGNVNAAPSVLGARYLPILLMAVALGARQGVRHSAFVFLAGFLSSLWSIEAFVGAVALYVGSLALLNLRDRSYGRLAKDLTIASLPMISGLSALSIGTLLVAGSWPAFDIYFSFLSSYNPLAQFWSIPFDARFWGWIPMLGAVAIAVAGCWLLVIDNKRISLQAASDTWLRHALPAAILTAITGAYFAGRSVDFTVLIALLPFALLFLPAALWLADLALSGDRVAIKLTVVPVVALFWVSVFSCLYLFRADSPYSLLLQECRDYDRCTPAALTRKLSDRVANELALRSQTGLWSLDDFDRIVVADAKNFIDRFSGSSTKVTVLLGESADGQEMLSDIAMMYAGKWHTWPRSFTFSDELVPALATRILASRVALKTGDLIVMRRNDAGLGPLEKAILDRIRASGSLCHPLGRTRELVAYQFQQAGDPQSSDPCIEQDMADDFANRSTEALQDIASLISGLRTVGHALPDGPVNFSALGRTGAEIPQGLVRGRRLVSFSGIMVLAKSGPRLTIDLHDLPRAACRQLLPPISSLAGVERMAVTGALADEQSVPISETQSERLCAHDTGFVRIIVDLGSRSRSTQGG
ncbi:hypothetical protein [Bradyrhizobium sp. CSS354]|uniref:hypothetical protein n=1 Tax=Bradyrhizobium sp. CSS354 TaxID=2699172 RepID=UPI0023B110C7|nr:hypothetical protein [Bradyrhizobium sp. CSS354]MDE5461756.1 hypothetical protein [Bradyrhizobium sp. CSS354]